MRSLSDIKSEYKKLCDELGGPADVGLTINKRNLETYCREYRMGQVLPILTQFQNDEVKARRHWPWAAFALSHYKFEHLERQKYADEPRPKEILELLEGIQQSAHDLGSALSRLQELSNRLADPTAPLRRPHLGWRHRGLPGPTAPRYLIRADRRREPRLLRLVWRSTRRKRGDDHTSGSAKHHRRRNGARPRHARRSRLSGKSCSEP